MEIVKNGIKHVGTPAELKEYFGEKKAKKKEPTFEETAEALMKVTRFDGVQSQAPDFKALLKNSDFEHAPKKRKKKPGRKRERQFKNWTTKEKAEVFMLLSKGKTKKEIGKVMHRTTHAIQNMVYKEEAKKDKKKTNPNSWWKK